MKPLGVSPIRWCVIMRHPATVFVRCVCAPPLSLRDKEAGFLECSCEVRCVCALQLCTLLLSAALGHSLGFHSPYFCAFAELKARMESTCSAPPLPFRREGQGGALIRLRRCGRGEQNRKSHCRPTSKSLPWIGSRGGCLFKRDNDRAIICWRAACSGRVPGRA